MSEFIEGTNIPTDPRKRTKNHGRLEITIWAEIPDSTLDMGGWKDATEALRRMEEGMIPEIRDSFSMLNQIPFLGMADFHVVTRVSQ